jgi:hypothetical protein
MLFDGNGVATGFNYARCMTDTSQRIAAAVNTNLGGFVPVLYINTAGYIDRRGRDA